MNKLLEKIITFLLDNFAIIKKTLSTPCKIFLSTISNKNNNILFNLVLLEFYTSCVHTQNKNS